jgi:hypothetical protein
MSSRRYERRQLAVIKGLVAVRAYDYSQKVRSYIEDGLFGIEDIEQCILGAFSISNIEPDERGAAADGCKYTIIGADRDGYPFYTCGKLLTQPDGHLYFFITAHEDNPT